MPRRTVHEWCVECGERAELGVNTWYYVFCGKSKTRPKSKQKSGQVKGTLTARGFCTSCFLKLAKEQDCDDASVKLLRMKLRGS
jgi:hypothetical protein